MIANRTKTVDRASRRGVAALEAIFALSLFMITVLGMIGIADLLITEQLLSEASGRGARVAALGGTPEQIQDAVQAVLGRERAANTSIYVGPVISETDAASSLDAVPPGGLIEVRIEIEAQHATATRLAPIRPTELLVGRTVMLRE